MSRERAAGAGLGLGVWVCWGGHWENDDDDDDDDDEIPESCALGPWPFLVGDFLDLDCSRCAQR